MSNSRFQDAAISAILGCVGRGNKARYSGDGRTLKKATYQEEYPTYYTGYTRRPMGRADLFMELTYDKNNKWELSEKYIFECKSSVDDLKSGYGLNFSGERNFIVIPDYEESVKYKSFPWKLKYEYVRDYLFQKGRNDVGILILKNDEIICKKQSWLNNSSAGWLFQVAFGDYYDETTSN